MSENLQRAQLLIDQGRYDDACKVLMVALAETPDHPDVHLLLAFCMSEKKDHAKAIEHAESAIARQPEYAYAHYAYASVLLGAGKQRQALAPAMESVRLETDNPTNHGIVAVVHMMLRNWREACEAAEAGLRLDPQNGGCLNVRAIALRSLGMTDESGLSIDSALSRDPEDSWSHANKGWNELHTGEAHSAVDSFKEALRLDPNSEWARAGLVEALKARNPVYACILRYFLWMSKLKPRVQIGLIIGAVVGVQFILYISQAVPALALAGQILVFLYILFVLTSWCAVPFFNLLLRFHHEGRHALNGRERRSATCLGIALLLIVAMDVFFISQGAFNLWLLLFPVLLVFPTVTACRARPVGPKVLTTLYTLAAAVLLIGAIFGGRPDWLNPYVWMCVLSTWFVNLVPTYD